MSASLPETKPETKPAKSGEMEVIIIRDYWPHGKPNAMRKDADGNDQIVEIDITLDGMPPFGKDNRLRVGDVVSLPRAEASKLVNAGAAKLPDLE